MKQCVNQYDSVRCKIRYFFCWVENVVKIYTRFPLIRRQMKWLGPRTRNRQQKTADAAPFDMCHFGSIMQMNEGIMFLLGKRKAQQPWVFYSIYYSNQFITEKMVADSPTFSLLNDLISRTNDGACVRFVIWNGEQEKNVQRILFVHWWGGLGYSRL